MLDTRERVALAALAEIGAALLDPHQLGIEHRHHGWQEEEGSEGTARLRRMDLPRFRGRWAIS